MAKPQLPMQFGPYPTKMGSKRKDRQTVEAGSAFYAGPGKDILTEGSQQVPDKNSPTGVSTISCIMSGGSGDDTYKFNKKEHWAFVADGGGGKDTVKFKSSSHFNPDSFNLKSDNIISTILINKRDVLVLTGNLTTAVIFTDPFGKLDKNNKIEKVQFGKKKYSFKKFYKSMKKAQSHDTYGDLHPFTRSTYAKLGATGILNLESIETEALTDGSAFGIAAYNNSLV